MLFLDKVVLQYYYADTCHGYTVHRKEWGLHVFWSWIYRSRWIVQAKNLLSHLSMLSSPCVIFFWNDEATDRLDWVGFQQYLWRSSFKHHDQILTTQPKRFSLMVKILICTFPYISSSTVLKPPNLIANVWKTNYQQGSNIMFYNKQSDT